METAGSGLQGNARCVRRGLDEMERRKRRWRRTRKRGRQRIRKLQSLHFVQYPRKINGIGSRGCRSAYPRCCSPLHPFMAQVLPPVRGATSRPPANTERPRTPPAPHTPKRVSSGSENGSDACVCMRGGKRKTLRRLGTNLLCVRRLSFSARQRCALAERSCVRKADGVWRASER